jgi:type IV pilus assembly protein PilQ
MNIFRLWLLFCGLLVYACGTPSATRVGEGQKESTRTIIDEIRNSSSQDYSAVTIVSSQASPYSSFKLMSPPRIIIDMKAEPEINLKKLMKVQDGLIDTISIGERGGPAGTTRIIVHLSKEDFEYNIKSEGNQLFLKVSPVSPKPVIQQMPPPPQPATAAVAEVPGPGPKPAGQGPRIFFRPGPSPLTQVLGVDFFLREGGRSRLGITTSKKVKYDVRKEGAEKLIVDLQNATIPPLLMKRLATQYFEGAVERIKVFSPSEDSKVSLEVLLRESVPYNVTQEEGVLKIDFDPSTKKPRQVGLRLEGQGPPPDSKGKPTEDESAAKTYEITTREYAGKMMSFDFVDTDIRNVLKLIAEVADLNIVWGSDVEGKISMKLEDVPWDQALEMVLKPNALTYQIEDSVIWVVPKARLIDMEIKERDRKGALLAQKRVQGIFETKILEYINIRHRKAQDIFRMLVGDPSAVPPIRGVLDIEETESKEQEKGEKEKGKESKLKVQDVYLTYDPETNMIIVNGVRSKVDKVKDIVAKLDVPQKQVMIEARIVEATTSFSRDVGIKWDTTFKSGDVTTKFATNFPKMPSDVSTLSLGYANAALTTVINAQIALAETDGRLTTLSAPKIITRDAATATIKQGTQIAVPSGKDDFGNIIYNMADAVLELTVTPKITANDMVVMTIDVKDDYPDYTNVQPLTESVPIKTKSARTETIVASGETLVIGGIYKEDKSFTKEGVPWLSEIPILGWLFRLDQQKLDKIELLIFLTPRVLKAGPKEL